MKIGFDAKRAYHNYTGLGNYSRDLIQNLLTYYPDFEYHLYAPKIGNNPRFKFVEQYDNVYPHFPESPLHKTFKGIWRSVDLEKFLVKDGIDIFHGLSNEIPRRKKKSNVKHLVTIHDLIFKRFPNTYKKIDRNVYNTKFKYAAQNADKVIAISQQTKQDIIDFYKVDSSKIEVIYQTCHQNFKEQYSNDFKLKVKRKFNLPDNYILNVGTIETRKNLNAILQAVPTMKNDLPIVVVGRKTKYMNFLKVQMDKLKVDSKRFIFLENVAIHELPSIYQMASVFVYPSVFEGFGIPIIEALYSKVPVITTAGGCFPEAGGEHSLYLDTNNFELLGNTIDDLLMNTNQQVLMKEKGYEYVQRFNPRALTEQLVNLYQNL
ncbi:MAG: glycosyltransferase family 4 protein [Flavobacteriales bacterium]|jgi:glycosyltransferase involved in cell wall biosynthesis|nr:glycosyltransferase family 4 protein [Flavobacteriales bacterium]